MLNELTAVKKANKEALADWLLHTQNVTVNTEAVFDIQSKRLHEYKRQQLNLLYLIHQYHEIKAGHLPAVPLVSIFGAKAAPGYDMAKRIIKLLCMISKDINQRPAIREKLNLVFLEDYNVSLAEALVPSAEISEQISLAGKEASGTGCMKLMINGALTIGTLDGANVEMQDAAGKENMFIFGASADEIINLENKGGYNPMDIFNNDQDIRRVLMQLINGYYSPQDPELFRDIYNSLLNTQSSDRADTYFILKDFRSYAEAHKKIDQAYRDEKWWARTAMLNTASAGKFSSDRTIEEYVRDIWHLKKIKVELK